MKMTKNAPLSTWPWENLGGYKYMLLGPLVGQFIHSRRQGDDHLATNWCFHILLISLLRFHLYMWCTNLCNMLFLSRNRRIFHKGIDFEQIDKERDWDNFVILQALIASLAIYLFPREFATLPVWEAKGIVAIVLVHVVVSEPLYYWVHRLLHGDDFFTPYHSFHHSSSVPQPVTAGSTSFLEELLVTTVMGLPIVGCSLSGYGSKTLTYAYVFVFDFLKCLSHSNVEVVPHWIFEDFPFSRYLIHTPTVVEEWT